MIELSVCIGSACHLNGAHNVVATFQHMIEEYSLHEKVNLKAAFCMKKCSTSGVAVNVNGQKEIISANSARKFFKENILPLV